MGRLRTLIVDDMALSRERLRRYLNDESDIEIVGECGDGAAALAAIEELSPNLLFLDVQMPEMDGFELLERVPTERRPAVVFVTAFDEFAVPAFEVDALDYLLKPFDRKRLQKALKRVREALEPQAAATEDQEPAEPCYLERIAVKSVGKTEFVTTDAVDWIETAGNYLCLHAGAETHLVRETMTQLEAKLDPRKFARIHRSTLVRIDRIKAMQPLGNGDQTVTLTDGARLTMSRSYRKKLGALLGAL